ncbi:MAG: hypothetical protein HRU38_00420 [Saccharospirillaceae bacterium]|nr:hypothetical protein [Colwellia sp.]NRB77126.1 hypothetical protein [Saccharospirillaceae bacterium]
MKSVLAILLSVTLFTGCQSTKKQEDVVTPVAMSHTAVMGISAFYYCANNQWPASIDKINEYEAQRKAMPHINVNWSNLKSISNYTSKPNYQLTSNIKQPDNSLIKLTSGQKAPNCDGNNAELQGAYVNM